MDEVLELAPEIPTLLLVRLDGGRLEQCIGLRVGVIGCIGEGQPDLEVLAPIGALLL